MCKKCDARRLNRAVNGNNSWFESNEALERILRQLREETNQTEEISEENPFG